MPCPDQKNSIAIRPGMDPHRVAGKPASGRCRTISIYLAGVCGSKLIPDAPQSMDLPVEQECGYLFDGIHVHGDECVGVAVGNDLLSVSGHLDGRPLTECRRIVEIGRWSVEVDRGSSCAVDDFERAMDDHPVRGGVGDKR